MTDKEHIQRLAAAGASVAAAQLELDAQAALVSREAELRALADAGTISAEQAREFVEVAEARRVGDITMTGRLKRHQAAKEAEVAVALEVLGDLMREAERLAEAAEEAAAALVSATMAPAARAWRVEEPAGFNRDRDVFGASRTWHGIVEVTELIDRLTNARRTTWGTAHIANEARAILIDWPVITSSIQQGISRIAAAAAAAGKVKKTAA